MNRPAAVAAVVVGTAGEVGIVADPAAAEPVDLAAEEGSGVSTIRYLVCSPPLSTCDTARRRLQEIGFGSSSWCLELNTDDQSFRWFR